MKNLHTKALQRAAQIKGGADALATHLNVSSAALLLWMQGKATLPAAVFEKVLDVLLEGDVAELTGAAHTAAKPPVRVLVVDDDASGAYGLAYAIRQLGHPVEIASDGPSALEAARRLRPDIIFLDLRMPGMDGVEIAHLLRAEGLGTHIIAATAYQSELERERTVAAGFDAHVVKPLEGESLQKLLTRLH